MNIKNLTPHEITIKRIDGSFVTIAPEDTPARCVEARKPLGDRDGIAITRATFGIVEDLPFPAPDDTIYVVSMMVLNAVPDRLDVFAPGPAIRDASGRIIACDGLSAGRAYEED